MEFYTVYEVAEILKVCCETIRRNIRNGALKAHKFGGHYRVSRAELERFVAESVSVSG